MNINDKLKFITGKNAWQTEEFNDIPSINMNDGPHGLRYVYKEEDGIQYSYKSVAYPTLSILSCSWDVNIIKKVGECIAEDCIKRDVDILLAPGVNIKRTPLCGRNFEYFSEDPYLSGVLGKAYIEGVQSKGIGTSLKHFVANNREYERFFQSSEIDERTLNEIYYLPFKIALEARPWTVMCSYNLLNGIYTSEHKYLLEDTLRHKFNFDGVIISDWGACKNRVKSLNASLDLAMPYDERFYNQLLDALNNNKLNQEKLNESCERLINLVKKKNDTKHLRIANKTDLEKYEIAVEAIEKSMVLLKNDGVLPLNAESILTIGQMSECPSIGGGGSSYVEPMIPIKSLKEELQELIPTSKIDYCNGYYINGSNVCAFGTRICMEKAQNNDVSIIVVGNNQHVELESVDRIDISINKEFIDLINNVSKVSKKTIVVIMAGSCVDVSKFEENVNAIVYAGFGGNGVLKGLANLLVGHSNFSGKLSETFVNKIEDISTFNNRGNSFCEVYNDRVFIGYRYYDSNKIDVKYPFGFGLSYSSFEYKDLKIQKLDETHYILKYKIKNTSNIGGEEISQVYIRDVFSMVSRPDKELKAFNKIYLSANEEKEIEIQLDDFAFSYYSEALKRFYVENGKFEVLIGASSRDIRLIGEININLDNEEQYSIY